MALELKKFDERSAVEFPNCYAKISSITLHFGIDGSHTAQAHVAFYSNQENRNQGTGVIGHAAFEVTGIQELRDGVYQQIKQMEGMEGSIDVQ